jgi:hypothetical protein
MITNTLVPFPPPPPPPPAVPPSDTGADELGVGVAATTTLKALLVAGVSVPLLAVKV